MPQPIFDMVITGLASRAGAEAKLIQLKILGISEGVQIKTEDGKRFSILMASFAERAKADAALQAAASKGVRSAAIVQRLPAPEQATIEVRGGDAVMKPLTELATLHRASRQRCAMRQGVRREGLQRRSGRRYRQRQERRRGQVCRTRRRRH